MSSNNKLRAEPEVCVRRPPSQEVEVVPYQEDNVSVITDMQTVQYEMYNSVYPSPADVLHITTMNEEDEEDEEGQNKKTECDRTADLESGLYPSTCAMEEDDVFTEHQRQDVIHKLGTLPKIRATADTAADPAATGGTGSATSTLEEQKKQHMGSPPPPRPPPRTAKAIGMVFSNSDGEGSGSGSGSSEDTHTNPSPMSSGASSTGRIVTVTQLPGAYASNDLPRPAPRLGEQLSCSSSNNNNNNNDAPHAPHDPDGDNTTTDAAVEMVVVPQAELAPDNYEELLAERDALRQTIESIQQAKVAEVTATVDASNTCPPQQLEGRKRRLCLAALLICAALIVVAIGILAWTQQEGDNDDSKDNNSVGGVGVGNNNSTEEEPPEVLSFWEARQIGQTILGAEAFGEYGEFLALNGDGTLLAVGGEEAYEFRGRVGLYQLVQPQEQTEQSEQSNLQQQEWRQLLDIRGDTPGEESGRLALSSQGNHLAVAGQKSSPKNVDTDAEKWGKVRTYRLSITPTNSNQQTASSALPIPQLLEGRNAGERFGVDVQFNADGTIMSVGSPSTPQTKGNETGIEYGAVRVFQFQQNTNDTNTNQSSTSSSSSWVQMGQELNGDHESDFYGHMTALSEDGLILAAGGYGSDSNGKRSGIIRVYKFDNTIGNSTGTGTGTGVWKQLGQDFYGEEAGDEIGRSISLSSDGRIIAFGGYKHNNGTGRIYTYEYMPDNDVWKQLGQSIDGTKPGDRLGRSIALSGDGSMLATGAYWNNDGGDRAGHVRVFSWNASTANWDQVGPPIPGIQGDWFGRRISMSRDGTTLAVGGPFHDVNGPHSGMVEVYSLSLQ